MDISKKMQMIRVAELYYLHNMTQQQIANIVGISRPTVSRLLEDAKVQGIVEIKLNISDDIESGIASELRERLGFQEVIVVNTRETEYNKSMEKLAKTAADYVTGVIKSNITIGVSWGRAMKALAVAMPELSLENVKVIQTVGGLGMTESNFDGTDVVSILASKLGGTHRSICGPAILPTKSVADELKHIPAIAQVLEEASRANIYITGIGSFDEPDNSLQRAGYISHEERISLHKRGAVANIMARILDEDGNEINDFNDRSLSISLDCLKGDALTIGISASENKAEAILAIAKGQYLNTLIIDLCCAQKVMECLDKKKHVKCKKKGPA